MTLKTMKWDTADWLNEPDDVAAYLEAALEDGDPHLLAAALGNIARSKGMTKIARSVGVTRGGLYKALSVEGDPQLSTFLGVIKSLGFSLSIHPARDPATTDSDIAAA